MNVIKSIQGKTDNVTSGIIAGIILPVIVYMAVYFSKIRTISETLFSSSVLMGNIIPLIISHCLLPNMLFFFLLLKMNMETAAKGVLAATLSITVLLFAIKLFLSFS